VPFLETCDNGTFICTSTHVVYTFNAANGFDTLLATMNSNSVHTAQMALGRMPVFASSDPETELQLLQHLHAGRRYG
jgi:hypothetical protein